MRRALFTALAALLVSGCHIPGHVDMWEGVDRAVAEIRPTEGNDVRGVVTFVEVEDGVRVTADIEGLEPDSTHGFHIHEFGDCTAGDGTSAAGHYNPEGHDHGLPGQEGERHAGDLGNITAGADGTARYEDTFEDISIAGLVNPIVGRGVIVHAQPDTGAQPTGEAGARIGCGVIGIAGAAEE